MKNTIRLLFFLSFIVLGSCIEPFDVSIPGGNNVLVVEGMITDEPGPYQVKLTRSSLLNESIFPPEEGALVGISEEGGDIDILREVSPGVYETQSIQGQPGKRYQLLVTLADGTAYNTDYILLKASPPVERVYSEVDEILVDLEPKDGVQFYVDSRDNTNQTLYYRYEWTESWIYAVPFPALSEYVGNDQTAPLPERIGQCWTFAEFSGINIANSLSNSEDVVLGHPLHFVTNDPERLKIRYGVRVKQFALTEEEYQFWEGLQETSAESGTLFDAQPQTLRSNLRRVDNPSESVFGYFSVSGVSTGTSFVSFNEVPFGVEDLYTGFCQGEFIDIPKTATSEFQIQELLDQGFLFYQLVFPLIGPQNVIGYRFITPFCGDCRERGGTLEMPEWWIP